jgi:hypothetical protein
MIRRVLKQLGVGVVALALLTFALPIFASVVVIDDFSGPVTTITANNNQNLAQQPSGGLGGQRDFVVITGAGGSGAASLGGGLYAVTIKNGQSQIHWDGSSDTGPLAGFINNASLGGGFNPRIDISGAPGQVFVLAVPALPSAALTLQLTLYSGPIGGPIATATATFPNVFGPVEGLALASMLPFSDFLGIDFTKIAGITFSVINDSTDTLSGSFSLLQAGLPEPSSFLILGGLGAVLLGVSRKRRKS